jgi:hypothetical protein
MLLGCPYNPALNCQRHRGAALLGDPELMIPTPLPRVKGMAVGGVGGGWVLYRELY